MVYWSMSSCSLENVLLLYNVWAFASNNWRLASVQDHHMPCILLVPVSKENSIKSKSDGFTEEEVLLPLYTKAPLSTTKQLLHWSIHKKQYCATAPRWYSVPLLVLQELEQQAHSNEATPK